MEDKIVLDGQEVSMEVLKEKMTDNSIKIVQISEGVYKTLQKLVG